MDSTDVIINRLLDRLLERRVVPFLGAGVSVGASSRTVDVHEASAYVPRVDAMVARLAHSLRQDLRDGPDAPALRALLLLPTKVDVVPPWIALARYPDGTWHHPPGNDGTGGAAAAPPNLDKIIDDAPDAQSLAAYLGGQTGNRLERWAEAHVVTKGRLATVQALRLDRLADLEPQPAHVYIAYLAREGLLAEVLTANYDTCIETALVRTLPPEIRSPAHPVFRVIDDSDAYGHHGGGPPVLRLYKPNGCAGRYKQAMSQGSAAAAEAAARLVLAERELHSFQTGRWFEDCLRDTARKHALLFCGFGNDEPQVRHTLLTVTREFADDAARRSPHTAGAPAGWSLPNAPFMVLFEPHLSFNQHQLMRGYADAYSADSSALGGTSGPLDGSISNVIGRNDLAWFEPDDPGAGARGLDGGVFWRRVFQAAFLRLVDRAARPEGLLRRWLDQHDVVGPALAVGRLKRWLGTGVAQGDTARTSWYGLHPELLEESEQALDLLNERGLHRNLCGNRVVGPLVLSFWILAVRGSVDRWLDARSDDGAPEPGHPYFALRDDVLLVLVTLLVVAALLEGPSAAASLQSRHASVVPAQCGAVHVDGGAGLRIQVAAGTFVYLVADAHRGDPDRHHAAAGEQRQRILQVVVPTRDHLPVDARVCSVNESAAADADGTSWLWPARIERIDAAELLRRGGALSYAEIVRRWAEQRPSPTRAKLEDI